MIRLVVEPYCQDCPNFEPHVEKLDLGDFMEERYDTTVYCEFGERCRLMEKRIKRLMEKESDR